eukprot:3010170-Pleurochrysis_carterae.AAC.1
MRIPSPLYSDDFFIVNFTWVGDRRREGCEIATASATPKEASGWSGRRKTGAFAENKISCRDENKQARSSEAPSSMQAALRHHRMYAECKAIDKLLIPVFGVHPKPNTRGFVQSLGKVHAFLNMDTSPVSLPTFTLA